MPLNEFYLKFNIIAIVFSNPKDVYNKIKVAASKFNIHLKAIAKKAGIEKKATMHIARHTFENIVGDTIHPLMLQ